MSDGTQGRELARKITIKTVTGGSEKWFERLMRDKRISLMRVYGVATKAQAGATDLGEFIKLHGTFKAVNLETGEIHVSTVVLLPNYVAHGIQGALEASGAQSVQFAYQIDVEFDPSVVTKYRYIVIDAMPASVADPLAQLETALGMRSQAPALVDASAGAMATDAAPAEKPAKAVAGRRK